jgi:hypothetical protein
MEDFNSALCRIHKNRVWQVYRLICIVTGKSYVGKGIGKHQWVAHKRNARMGYQTHFCSAIRKYGEQSFELKIEAEFFDEADAYAFETKIIENEDLTHNGYNEAPGMIVTYDCDQVRINRAMTVGKSWTSERRKSVSHQYTDKGNPFFGKHHTDVVKNLIGQASANNIEAHQKIAKALTGRKHTSSTKKLMSESSPTHGKTLEEVFGNERANQIKEHMRLSRPDRRGEKHPGAKLSNDDVRIIRERSLNKQTDEILANEFHVSKRTIEKIRLRYSWKHL